MSNNQYIRYGLYFGFPKCCIRSFLKDFCKETKEVYPDGPWMGSGFIPCMTCAPQASVDFKIFVKKKIKPNRKHFLPFPLDHGS